MNDNLKGERRPWRYGDELGMGSPLGPIPVPMARISQADIDRYLQLIAMRKRPISAEIADCPEDKPNEPTRHH